MSDNSYLQQALSIFQEDRGFYLEYHRRTLSNLKLIEEYLRRLKLWMDRLAMPFDHWWENSDLAAALDPSIRAPLDTQTQINEIAKAQPYSATAWQDALHWSVLRDHRPDLIEAYNLPDPYEPFFVLLKRAGGFYIDEGILGVISGDVSILSREISWLTMQTSTLTSPESSIIALDENTLNVLDASTPKLYGFLPEDNYGFYAGQDTKAYQYFIVEVEDIILIMKFSPTGELVEVIEKEHFQNSYDEETAERYDEKIAACAVEFALKEMQITVQKFLIPKYHFGIRDMPKNYEDFVADKTQFALEEHAYYETQIKDWQEGIDYVLQLGPDHDFWTNIEGVITGT